MTGATDGRTPFLYTLFPPAEKRAFLIPPITQNKKEQENETCKAAVGRCAGRAAAFHHAGPHRETSKTEGRNFGKTNNGNLHPGVLY